MPVWNLILKPNRTFCYKKVGMFGKVKKYEIESWVTFWQSTLRVHFQKAYLEKKKKKS